MKASISRGIGHGFTVADVQIADPAGQEVLVDVRASGLCATDLSIVTHDAGLAYPFPAVLGHEIAGVAVQVGPAVRGVRVGDHVVGSLIQYCGACRACLAGRQFECSDTGATVQHEGGSRLNAQGDPVYQGSGLGGFAEMALVHENQLAVIPDDVPFPQASLLGCGTITGAGAVINTAKVRPGESVVVIGTGGVGLNAISGALIAGATTIVAVDIVDAKLDLAKRFGATHTVNSASVDVVAAVQEITHGGADHVFEVIGLPATQRTAIEVAGINGGST